ncbi:hypothetical protein X975_04381, partial [Stegodyphus mimosarum]
MSCRGKTICACCSVEGHDSENCNAEPLCANCKGNHAAFLGQCPKWKAEKEVQTTKVTKNISYAEARKLITDAQPRKYLSYAGALKSFKSVSTQTAIGLPNKQPIQNIQKSKSQKSVTSTVQAQQNRETNNNQSETNKERKKTSKPLRDPSLSSFGSISDNIDSEMDVEEGLDVPKHLLPRKSKQQHRK